jgi:hypothetical protein
MGAMKNILIDIQEAMYKSAHNLEVAAEEQDPDLMEAVMVNILSCLPSYLEALRKVKS